jgi:hypothetical protein
MNRTKCTLVNPELKSHRHRKVPESAVTALSVCNSSAMYVGAIRRLESASYLMLLALAILRHHSHCTWSAIRHHFPLGASHSSGCIIQALPLHMTDDLKTVADMLSPGLYRA